MSANKVKDTQEFSAWYNDVIFKAELVDEIAVKGCNVIRPYGWAIWENIVKELDARIKAEGVQNACFPLFIPESFLTKEKEHVEGFSPELAVVTHAGGKKLEEPLVVRPTSETLFYTMFARWISSYRDLPLKINQWANVVRWEMRSRPFLRTAEFFWQEGHTAHETQEEAWQTALRHQQIYKEFAEEFLAIPAIPGPKTDSEKFAGAHTTFTLEAMMQDGRALQLCTSHLLAESFPRAFGVSFQDREGKVKTPWCTSWGWTTRSIGAMIMVHGDSAGLVIPPKIAPIQVIIVPIYKTSEQESAVLNYCQKILSVLIASGIRGKLDSDATKTPGSKFHDSELKGIPLRIEVGPRDLEANSCMFAPRIRLSEEGKGKFSVQFEDLASRVEQTLVQIHELMLERARSFLAENIYEAGTFQELSEKIEQNRGFYKIFWCRSSECEAKLKEIKASARVVVETNAAENSCFYCQKMTTLRIIAAKSY